MKKDKKIIVGIITIVFTAFLSSSIIFYPQNEYNLDVIFLMHPISSITQQNSIIYAANSTIENNTYGIRIDSGEIYIEYMLNLTSNMLNGNSVVNSTAVINSTILYETNLGYINIFNNVKLVMKHIWEPKLNIYLFDNSELTLENCSLNSTVSRDSSIIIIKNSSINYVFDFNEIIPFFTIYNGFPVDYPIKEFTNCQINILNESIIKKIDIRFGSNLVMDNSTVQYLNIGGSYTDFGYPNTFGNATIINSTISNYAKLGGTSNVTVFGSYVEQAWVFDLSRLTAENSTINNLAYGIICSSGVTNINNGIPLGSNYENNTQLINSTLSGASLFYSVGARDMAEVLIDGWQGIWSFIVYSHDQAKVVVNNTDLLWSVFTYDNSLLECYNLSGIMNNLFLSQNSSLYCYNCSPLLNAQLMTTGSVIILNSSITNLKCFPSYGGNPISNISIINTTITKAYIYGSSRVGLINSSIDTLIEGIVVHTGTIIFNLDGLSGSGSYTNYTRFTSTTISSRFTGHFEVNNSATLNITDISNDLYVILTYQNSQLNLYNTTLTWFVSNYNDSTSVIRNSTMSMLNFDHSICYIENSTLNNFINTGNSQGSIFYSSIYNAKISDSSRLTIHNTTISNTAKIMSSFLNDYPLKILANSFVKALLGTSWRLLY